MMKTVQFLPSYHSSFANFTKNCIYHLRKMASKEEGAKKITGKIKGDENDYSVIM